MDDEDDEGVGYFFHPIELLRSLIWNTEDFRVPVALESVVLYLDSLEEGSTIDAEDIYEVIAACLSMGQTISVSLIKPERQEGIRLKELSAEEEAQVQKLRDILGINKEEDKDGA